MLIGCKITVYFSHSSIIGGGSSCKYVYININYIREGTLIQENNFFRILTVDRALYKFALSTSR